MNTVSYAHDKFSADQRQPVLGGDCGIGLSKQSFDRAFSRTSETFIRFLERLVVATVRVADKATDPISSLSGVTVDKSLFLVAALGAGESRSKIGLGAVIFTDRSASASGTGIILPARKPCSM